MAKKFLRRISPSHEKIRADKNLARLSRWLHDPNLWHLNRRSASLGLAVGLFWAFVPMPLQMIPSAITVIFLRANLPLAIFGAWVTNPITIPPLAYFCYWLGARVLGTPVREMEFDFSWQWVTASLSQIWQPFLLGCFLTGTASALVAYFGVRALWRLQVVREWQRRKKKR